MTTQNETARLTANETGRESKHHTSSIAQPSAARNSVPKKWQRVLAALLCGPRNSRELERDAHDHVPHSTISDLRKRGIYIETEMIAVPGYAGEPARIARYSIAAHSIPKARALLGLVL